MIKAPNNKFNSIEKNNTKVIKRGPKTLIEGELYYYQHIPPLLKHLFPTLYQFSNDDSIKLEMDYIEGVPLFFLYKDKQVTTTMIDDLFYVLNQLHHTCYTVHIKEENVYNNYFKKLEKRFNKDYFFEDATIIYQKIIHDLKKTYCPTIVGVIHGDFWFSNILKTDFYKLIDMKGQVDSVLTLNGDVYYDYGKMYQSIIGYDLILNGYELDQLYIHEMETYFLSKCKDLGLNISYLESVRNSLIFGTIPFIETEKSKQDVWNFLKYIIYGGNKESKKYKF
jgi:hypothetical protein